MSGIFASAVRIGRTEVSGAIYGVRRVAALVLGDPVNLTLLFLLVLANAVLILNSYSVFAVFDAAGRAAEVPQLLNIGAEGSLGEILNYLQAAACAALLLGIWLRTRVHLFLVWALLFGFIVIDDAFKYHETMGGVLRDTLRLHGAAGVGPKDLGEVLAFLIAGLVFAAPMLLALRQRAPNARGYAWVFLVCLAALVFFGIGVDVLHEMTGSPLVGHIEDGGEMFSIAIAAIAALAIFRSRPDLALIATAVPADGLPVARPRRVETGELGLPRRAGGT